MNPFELRLGNYVDTINRSGKVHLPNNYPIKIMSIGLFKCRFILSEQHPAQVKEYNVVDNADICGLKLTEDWLFNFGFTKVGSNYEKEWFLLHTNIKTGTIDFLLVENNSTKIHSTIIEFVNQLQNIYFSITSKELEFKPNAV